MTVSWTATAGAGVAAGLGVAMPLGAVGVLLLREGLRSWRTASAGASAVAVVDLVYATAATALGPIVSAALSGVEAWVRLVSAGVLVLIAGHGLWSLRSAADVPAELVAAAGGSAARTFARFGVLTLINPTTALYFAALTTAQGDRLATPATGAIFVAGVFAASLLWQQMLALAGAAAAGRLAARARVVTCALGYGLVAVYALMLAWPLPG